MGALRSVKELQGDAIVARDRSQWPAESNAVLLDADTEPAVAEILDHLGADVAVIRPDRYVLSTNEASTGCEFRTLLTPA